MSQHHRQDSSLGSRVHRLSGLACWIAALGLLMLVGLGPMVVGPEGVGGRTSVSPDAMTAVDRLRCEEASLLELVLQVGDMVQESPDAEERKALVVALKRQVAKLRAPQARSTARTLAEALKELEHTISLRQDRRASLWPASRERLGFLANALRQPYDFTRDPGSSLQQERACLFWWWWGGVALFCVVLCGSFFLRFREGQQISPCEGAGRTLVSGAEQARRTGMKTQEATGDGLVAGCPVLLVDDSPVNLEVDTLLLARLGLTVETANSGAQALAMVRAGQYRLVLLDLSMPGMDGFETARRLRGLKGGLDVRIAALTAHTTDSVAERCQHAGFDCILSKPLTMEAIRACLSPAAGTLEAQKYDIGAREKGLLADMPSGVQMVLNCPDALARLDIDLSTYAQVLEPFLDALPEYRAKLIEAFAQGEWERLSELVHRIKGECANVGAEQAWHAAIQVEEAMLQEGAGEAGDTVVQLVKVLQALFRQCRNGAWRNLG